MKRSICLTFLLLLIALIGISQDDAPEMSPKFSDRLIFGGGLGLQFGTLTLIDISPVVGYRITPKLEAGIGATYKYYKYKDFYFDQTTGQKFDLKSNIFGASIYTRYHILDNIFLHGEFERLRYDYDDIYYSGGTMMRNATHTYINSLLLGGGLRQRISDNSYFYVMALWNLTEDAMSPYSNPIIRMGMLFGR